LYAHSYAASFHQCLLDSNLGIPYAVSLVGEQCQAPNNILKVIVNDDESEPEVEFAVCVTPFNFAYNNVHQLVEMIELNRLLGARRFTFYNFSTGVDVDKYLRVAYDVTDDITVIPWHVPLAVDVWPHDPKVIIIIFCLIINLSLYYLTCLD